MYSEQRKMNEIHSIYSLCDPKVLTNRFIFSQTIVKA